MGTLILLRRGVQPDFEFLQRRGHTLYDVVNPAYTPTPNEIQQATNDFVMGRLGWRWTIIPRLLVETHVAYLLAPDSWSNVYRQSLENDHDSEWVAGGTVVWSWQRDYVLEGRVWVPT